MTFWETVADSSKRVAENAVNVAGEVCAQGKEKIEIMKLRQKLREKYRSLGRIQYCIERGLNVRQGRKEVILSEIDELNEELDDSLNK